jgi:hypothetical protein
MRWEMFTLLAHGAFVTMIDKTAYDGSLDPVAYERFGQLLGEARSKRAHFGHAPVRDVGIYFSAATRDGYGRDKPAAYFQSVQGVQKACVYEHVGFGFLFDESLSLEALRQFPVVCLPNAAILGEREAALFRQYVEEGGNLLITGQSGQYDRLGKPAGSKTGWSTRTIGYVPRKRSRTLPSRRSRKTGLFSCAAPLPSMSLRPPPPWVNCSIPIAVRWRIRRRTTRTGRSARGRWLGPPP